jgi:hypothetical protein
MTFEQWKENKQFTKDIHILKLRNENEDTIAHIQANYNFPTENIEILKLTNKFSESVAHYQAEAGWTTENKELLILKDDFLKTVASIQIQRGWKPPTHLKKVIIEGITLHQMYRTHQKSKI